MKQQKISHFKIEKDEILLKTQSIHDQSIDLYALESQFNLEGINNLKKIENIIDENNLTSHLRSSDKARHFSSQQIKNLSNHKRLKSSQLTRQKNFCQQRGISCQENLIKYSVLAINEKIKQVYHEIIQFNMARKASRFHQRQEEINFKKRSKQIEAQKDVKTQAFTENEDTQVLNQNRQVLRTQRQRQEQQKKNYLMRRLVQLQKQLAQQEKKSQNLYNRGRKDLMSPSQEIIMQETQCLEDDHIQIKEQQLDNLS